MSTRIAADTSVLVPSVFEKHPHHEPSFTLLERARQGAIEMSISMHAIAEIYATLTSKATGLQVPPADAAEIIDDLLSYVRLIDVTGPDYVQMIAQVSERGLSSGVIYDAIHHAAACKAQAERLVTNNLRDFHRVCARPGFICRPEEVL